MCLATAYKDRQSTNNIVMKSVQRFQCEGDTVILTDLMERQLTIRGRVLAADLTKGYVLVQESDAH